MMHFDDFDAGELDLSLWIPAYLPQWSSLEATRPRFRIDASVLTLTIEPDQQPWSPEFNGPVRVSNLQTGVWSGPLGSNQGQHRFSRDLRVREPQEPRATCLPHYGRVEFRCRCQLGPTNVAALWLIGYEDRPERSGELCLFELKGHNVGPLSSVVGFGIHPFGDSSLTEDFHERPFELDVTQWHTWAVDWKPNRAEFSVDGRVFQTLNQAPVYPLQLMLNLYDLAPAEPTTSFRPEFQIDWVRVDEGS